LKSIKFESWLHLEPFEILGSFDDIWPLFGIFF